MFLSVTHLKHMPCAVKVRGILALVMAGMKINEREKIFTVGATSSDYHYCSSRSCASARLALALKGDGHNYCILCTQSL